MPDPYKEGYYICCLTLTDKRNVVVPLGTYSETESERTGQRQKSHRATQQLLPAYQQTVAVVEPIMQLLHHPAARLCLPGWMACPCASCSVGAG